ncbi:DUF11 domain-containing protein [Streptomyces sp. C]|uniref:DUF11 domain-containing protein n=1 Tax=Streptomyces sp. C TaxID=253839 RepID=UPI0001B56C86|nr:DUF11 domain-containing protein [Streptomyces sp. C]
MAPAKRARRVLHVSAAGLACALAAVTAPPAQAAEPVTGAPTLMSLRLDAPTAYLTFRDNSEPDISYTIVLTEKDNPGYTKIVRTAPGGVPGTGRVATRSADGIKPGVAYCATIRATVHYEESVPQPYELEDPVTPESNKVCADPVDASKPGSAPTDLSVGPITGEANPPSGTNRNYWVGYSNKGATATGVVLEVWATGPMTLRRPPAAGTFSGFTCAPSGASGFRCTGGTVKAGEKNQIPLLITVTNAGNGTVHASITGARDANTADNGASFAFQAVPRTP